MFTFATGGWVLVVTGSICLALIIWAIAPAIMRHGNRPPGDGKHIESYGFDVSNLAVPRSVVTPAMLYRDMIPVMWTASFTGPDEQLPIDSPNRWERMQKLNDPKYGKFLVNSDTLIGVTINGESRAYPMSLMYVHEIINDTLGGVPIAVTYNMPCDSVAVFDRRVDGRTFQFGHSSLVYNSNVLMYDRAQTSAGASESPTAPPAAISTESLWCQLLGRAVSGPLAGQSLTTIPAEVTAWKVWSKDHPSTTVLNRDPAMAKRYADAAPTPYFNSKKLMYPVDPMPSDAGPPAKTRMIIVSLGEARRVYRIDDIVRKAGTSGVWNDTLGDVVLTFHADAETKTVTVTPPAMTGADKSFNVIYSFWFAWHAMHPEDEIVQ